MTEKRPKDTPLEGGTPAADPEPATDSSSSPEQEEKVGSELEELAAGLERERDEYLELARRTKADFENYRKRVDREAAQAEARGRAELARRLLPVLDNLERALAAAQSKADRPQAEDRDLGGMDGSNHIAEGIRLVYEELAGVLKGSGIESYEPRGERFDPEWHEAMMTRPAGAEGAGKVLEVLEKGYRLNGQVLRPARVVVGAEQQASAGQPEDGQRQDDGAGGTA